MNLVGYVNHLKNRGLFIMEVIIDRFEGNYAIVELPDMTFEDMPISLIPSEAKEGDVISIEINSEVTNMRKSRINKLMDDLWE